jgi:hypothetical protein
MKTLTQFLQIANYVHANMHFPALKFVVPGKTIIASYHFLEKCKGGRCNGEDRRLKRPIVESLIPASL